MTNYEIVQFDPSDLTPEQIAALSPLTENKYRCCLKGVHPDGVTETVPCIIAALHQGSPIGLALASYVPILRFAELHSIHVKESDDFQEIGKHLLAKLDEVLKQTGCLVITFNYFTDTPETEALETLFASANWKPPKTFSIHCHFLAEAFSPEWLENAPQLPDDFEIFPWTDLLPKERERLLFHQAQGVIPLEISPFNKREKLIEPLNSLGLRHRDEVVGWMVTHRINPDRIQYSSLYIHREFQRRAIAIRLLSESIMLQKEAQIPLAELEVNVQRVDVTWINFVKRRLIPFANKVFYTKQTWRHLKETV